MEELYVSQATNALMRKRTLLSTLGYGRAATQSEIAPSGNESFYRPHAIIGLFCIYCVFL